MIKTTGTLYEGEISNNQAITYAGGGVRIDGKFTYNGGIIKQNSAGTTGGGIDYINGILYNEANDVFDNTATTEGNDYYPDMEHNIDWTKDETLNLRSINVSLLKAYVRGTDIPQRATQGMTVTDKYIVFTLWLTNEDTTMIAIVDKNTGEILNIVDGFEFKHANDMTYDSKNDEIYILTSNKKIAKFKINEQYEITDLQYVDCNRYYSGIAYNKDNDGFIGMSAKKMYILNNKFEEQSMFETPTTLTTQGIGYYNGNIYFCCTEFGYPNTYQTIYNNREKLSNLIYKYDLNGNLVETLHIKNTTLSAEVESCAFEEDGTLVTSYNTSTISLYKSDIIAPSLEVYYNTTGITNNDVIVTINSNEKIQEIEGWEISEDRKILTKTYTQNAEEEITINDIVGNSTSKSTIKINNIDKIKPETNISYSITELTNKDIIVTITSNEPLKEIEGWYLSEDKKVLTKKFTSNTEENITISDLAGNTISDTIKINNIDKHESTQSEITPPEITPPEVIPPEVTPPAVTQIDTSSISNTDSKAISSTDKTTAKTNLPQTGEIKLLIFIALLVIISAVMYIKYKKYKNI